MSDDRAFYEQGLAQARQQDFAGAIAQFSQALLSNPDFAEAFYQRGLAYLNLGYPQQAVMDYASAIQRQPTNAKFYLGRGLAYLNLGHLREALADANQTLRLDATHAPSYSLRGTVCQRLGELPEAIASYKQAAQHYLDQKDATNGRYCLEQIQRLQTPTPTQAAAAIPPEISAFFQEALAKAKQGWYAKALADLDWAIQIDPQDAQAYCYRAQVRREMQNWYEALADYRQAAHLFSQRADKGMLRQTIAAIEQIQALQSVDRRLAEREAAVSYRAASPAVPLSWETQRQLLRLTADDRKTAMRLVNQLKLRHPGMLEAWYWEKAIYDLERDRWR